MNMVEILTFEFFQNAILASVLVSIACGIIGSLIMINRLFSMAGGITHAAFGGIGIAFYFGLPLFVSTSLFTLFIGFLVAFLTQHKPHRSDSIIAVIWAFGMALGLILLDLTPGYKSDIMAYLFGSILAISKQDLNIMLISDCIFALLILLFYRQFEAISFDRDFAQTKGVATTFFHYLLIAMIAFCIVICIKAVGLILVIALLSIPCFIAETFTKKLGSMMLVASCLSLLFCLVGLTLSYYANLTSSAMIIMVACVGFTLCLLPRSH